MPTYVYRCSECDAVFEAFQRITAEPLESCPNGHVGTVKRVIQPVAIAFSGAGFHVNDYAPSGASGGGGAKEGGTTADASPAPAKEVATTDSGKKESG